MVTTQMTKRPGRFLSFEHHEVIADGLTGDYILLPPLGNAGTKTTCTIIAGTNTGKFQYSTSALADINDDSAIWVDWKMGEITGSDSDTLLSPVTALRGVSISGEITIDVII